MRNATLHATLRSFTAQAARRLDEHTAGGGDIPFELVVEPGTRPPLYVLRPLTGRYIADHMPLLTGLDAYGPAVRALSAVADLPEYLRHRGRSQVPAGAREQAREALQAFLEAVFAERSRMRFEPGRFDAAYAQLEVALYAGRGATTVLAPVAGLALAHPTSELTLGGGVALVRGDRVPEAPAEATATVAGSEPRVLATVTLAHDEGAEAAAGEAVARLRRMLTALRLLRRDAVALGPLAWMSADGGAWRPLAIGARAAVGSITFLSASDAEPLRALQALLERRAGDHDEVGWALTRFTMGADRDRAYEALTDHMLALRALLEPEGCASGRLPGRVAALCAEPGLRTAVTERLGEALALERALMVGSPPARSEIEAAAAEVAGHLRAVLGQALSGRGAAELCAAADDRLLQAAIVPS